MPADDVGTGATGAVLRRDKIGKSRPAQRRSGLVRFASERTVELEPIDPETALEPYLAEKETAVSDRANVSPEVIDQHYDQRTQKEKMEQRRQYLDKM